MSTESATPISPSTPQGSATKAEALADFGLVIGLDLAAITQRGRDPELARFTFKLTNGRDLRIGGTKILTSQAELSRVLLTLAGVYPQRVKMSEWQAVIGALAVRGVIDVEEVEGESLADSVGEWLDGYLSGAIHDRDAACGQGLPFIEDDLTHIAAIHFSKYLRREQDVRIERAELFQALADLGYKRKAINYDKGGKRSTKSYYVRGEVVNSLPVLGKMQNDEVV